MRTLLLSLLFASQALAAQLWVQNGLSTCNAASGAITCVLTVTAGNTLHIGLGYRAGAPAITSVTSTGASNTPALASSQLVAGASPAGAWLYCMPITTGGSITITSTHTGAYFFGNVVLQEFSGSTCTADGTGTSSGTNTNGNNPQCSAFTPTSSSSVAVMMSYYNGGSNVWTTVSAGYTTNPQQLFSANGRHAGMIYGLSPSGSQTPTLATSSTSSWAATCTTFLASGGATSIPHRAFIQ